MKNFPLLILPVCGISLLLYLSVPHALSADGQGGGHKNVWMSISPKGSSLPLGQSLQFTATVWGTDNKSVNWLVNGNPGGNSTVGTISPSGLYTAPSALPSTSVRVTAQCIAQPSASASTAVFITPGISVSISPSSSSVQVSQPLQFTATVSDTTNTAVNWLVNGTMGGNITVGTITSSGLYTAPAAVPSGSVTVTAQSVAQATASASAAVSIMPLVSVSISPPSASLQVSQSQPFSATVTGTSNTGVNWMVNGSVGGNSTVGAISSSGVYTAPATVPSGSITVAAQSVAQPAASASAAISITPLVSVSISPSSSSVQVSQSQQFTATVSGATNMAVNWLVNGTIGGNTTVGSITPSGLYNAPATVPSGSVTVTAQSVAQATASASATVSITPLVSVSISPSSSSVQVSQSQQFSATVSGTNNTGVSWLVNGSGGGNSTVGTITSSGLYTAPATVPSGTVVVTAQSTYQPSSSASANITISPPAASYVNLSWNASASSVAGYNIYRGSQSTGPFTKINSSLETATVYTDNAVSSGQTYYYATTAVNSSGIESTYSNVAQAIVP